MPDGEQQQFWSDLRVGETLASASIVIEKDDIFEFAKAFDPQPYHLDQEAGDNSIFGGLCASGWHVTAIMMRLLSDAFQDAGIDLLGSNAVPAITWRKPVLAGDALIASFTLAELRTGEDHRFGLVDCDIDVANQDGVSVMFLTATLMVANKVEVEVG